MSASCRKSPNRPPGRCCCGGGGGGGCCWNCGCGGGAERGTACFCGGGGRFWAAGAGFGASVGAAVTMVVSGTFAVGQPDIVDRMLDAVQARARRIHPAGKDPLHFALQRDLVDLDKGVGVGGLGRRAGIAGVGLDPQRAELDGLADILVEIDDAPGDLVEPGKARLLVDDLLRRRLGDHLVAGLQAGRRLRHVAPPLGWRCPGSGAAPGGATPGPGCGGATAMPGWVFCGMTVVPGGGASGCVCTDPGGGTPCPGGGRLGVGSRRPRGSSGTCSSSSSAGGCSLPRGIAPGGRGAGSEKILPICARAGGASEIVEAATRAAIPVRAMVRNISRLQKANRARDIVQTYPPLAG